MSTLTQAENPRGGSGETGIRSDSCALVCVLRQRLGIPLCRKRMTEGGADESDGFRGKKKKRGSP